jgi:formylglycine-generating enzyme
MLHKGLAILLLTAASTTGLELVRADVFNMPLGQTSLEFVTVGDPGNTGDSKIMDDNSSGYGAVSYVYKIGTYDVTAAQYTQFLNAVAATDPYGLYNTSMANVTTIPYQVGSGILRIGSSGSYTYSVVPGRENFPINWVSWGDAVRFANWLQNGQPSGVQGPRTTETGAYTLNGATSNSALMAVNRNAGATYFLPSENEWYKAAFYKGGSANAGYWLYPTRSNSTPSYVLSATGTNNASQSTTDNYNTSTYSDPVNLLTSVGDFASSPGPYGTYDQGGDVRNWNEANGVLYRGKRGWAFDTLPSSPLSRAGQMDAPTIEYWDTGFRVGSVAIPEPSTLVLSGCGLAVIALAFPWRRRECARMRRRLDFFGRLSRPSLDR